MGELETLLRELVEEVRGLRQDLARRRDPPCPPVDDPQLLLAVAAAAGGHTFSAAELFEHARVDGDLHQALSGISGPQRLGKRLRALAGRPLGGLVLERVGRDNSGTIWEVQVAPDLHGPAGVGPLDGA